MINGWNRVPIKTIYSGLFDGPHATPKPSDEGPVFLGIKNISEDGHLLLNDIRHIAEEDFPKWTRRVCPQHNDIVFTYEATLNLYALIPQGLKCCLGRRLALIRPKQEKVDPKFLYFYFFSDDWRKTVATKTVIGSTVDRIPLLEFPDFPINLPSLPTQRKIAGILSAYDDLIENNTRRIAILEEMAQAIYREWFVHFRFPGHEKVKLVDSALGKIPEGWKVALLPTLCRQLTDGTHDSPKSTDEGYPLVTGKHLNDGFINFDECYLISKEDHDEVMRRCHPESGDIIYSNIGTLGNTVLVDGDREFSIKNVALFKPLDRAHSHYLYLYLSRNETLESMIRRASGTSQKFLSLVFLRNEPILYPDKQVLLGFDEAVCPIIRQRFVLHKRVEILRKTRDLLLPKLISGQVDVEGLEIEIPKPD